MIPGSNQPPYREPCPGTVLCGQGPRYQHARRNEQNIPVFICDTLLPNAYIPPRGDIHPYERFNDLSAGPNCASDFCGGGAPAPCIEWIGTGGNGTQFDLDFPPPTDTFYQPQIVANAVLISGGANYQPGDILTANGGQISTYIAPDGGSFSGEATISIGQVSNTGAIQTFGLATGGTYSTPPSTPNNPSGGHGTGAEFSLTFANQTENLSPCHKFGYKNVQAKRQWHGTFGWMRDAENIGVYMCSDAPCQWNFYNEYDLSAPQSKYTTVSFEADYSVTSPFGSPNCSDTITGEISVDPTSGIITVDSLDYGTGAAASYEVVTGYDTFGDPALQNVWSLINMTAINLIKGLVTVNTPGDTATDVSCSDDGASFVIDGFTYTESWTLGSSMTFMFTNIDEDGFGQSYNVSVSPNSFSFIYYSNTGGPDASTENFSVTASMSGSNTTADVLDDIYTLLDEWDLTNDTVYPWRTDSYTSIAPLVMRNEPANNVSPLDMVPYDIGSTPITDCFGYDPSNPFWTPSYAATAAVDPNTPLYDGSVIGAPLPAGYQQTFDWYYTDWQSCFDSDTHETVGYIMGWGKQNLGQNGIPRTATNWTTNDLAWRLTGGAWIFYGIDTGWGGCVPGGSGTWPGPGIIIAQKWAETKMGFPSENFFRPAGDDKFAYDENHVYTINSITGSGNGAQVELQLLFSCDSPNGSSNPIASISGLWGGPSVNGFYTLSNIANGQTVTLGTKVYDVPSDWMSQSDWQGNDETDDTFGRLRWSTTGNPLTDPPAILGRAAIANWASYNGSNSVTEITVVPLPNLGMGVANADHVDIFDKFMGTVLPNIAIARIDDTHFTINAHAATYANAAWMMSTNSPNYAWNDQYPKGDFVYNDFTYWPRMICEAVRLNSLANTCSSDANCACPGGTYTEYCFPFYNPFEDEPGVFDHAFTQQANCVPFTPCNPSVLCISPNNENFAAGATYPFPASDALHLDEDYGSGWYAEFQQVIVDPLYQIPHFPASGVGNCNAIENEFSWEMDDGGCQEDDPGATPPIEYFPHAPLVEARLAIPNGAPSLPNGITLGWESPAGLTDCLAIPADTLFPPGPLGYSLSAPNPIWAIWSIECQCIEASGRFASQYQNQIIGCL